MCHRLMLFKMFPKPAWFGCCPVPKPRSIVITKIIPIRPYIAVPHISVPSRPLLPIKMADIHGKVSAVGTTLQRVFAPFDIAPYCWMVPILSVPSSVEVVFLAFPRVPLLGSVFRWIHIPEVIEVEPIRPDFSGRPPLCSITHEDCGPFACQDVLPTLPALLRRPLHLLVSRPDVGHLALAGSPPFSHVRSPCWLVSVYLAIMWIPKVIRNIWEIRDIHVLKMLV